MKAVEAIVITTRVLQIQEAANRMEIDMVAGEQNGSYTTCHFLVQDYGDLIVIGFAAGLRVADDIINKHK